MTLLEKIDSLIRRNDLNKRQLSIKSGIAYSTIDAFYKVGYENMKLSTFKTLCSFFGVTMDSMAWDDREIEYAGDRNTTTLSRNEQEILKMYAEISEEGKRIIDRSLKEAYTVSLEKKEEKDSRSLKTG